MEIILVRHGITESNVKGITNGQGYDDNLTKEGKVQAYKLGERLASEKIEQIYSSPLKRATETALPIAEKINKPIDIDIRLIEVSFGNLEGKPNLDIGKVLGKSQTEAFNDYQYDFRPFGGESSKEVETRVRSFLKDLKRQPYKKVLIISHGGIVRWIRYICTGEKVGPHPNAQEIALKIK